MTELEEKIYGKGSITLSHTLTKGITPMNEIVLSRLRTERDYAVENNYITDDGYFIADEEELSYHTGLSEDAVRASVKNLIRRNLIQGKMVEDFCLVHVDDEQIIRILEEFENEYSDYYGNWDKDLKKVQMDILKLDVARKENNNENTAYANKKIGEFKITRNIKNDNSNNDSALSKH